MNFHPTNARSKAARRARRGRIAAANAAPQHCGLPDACGRQPGQFASVLPDASSARRTQHRTFIVLPHPPSICMEQETSLPPSARALICETLLPLFATLVAPASLPNANLKGLP